MRSIFGLFLTLSFETLSSLCRKCGKDCVIVGGRYQGVPLTSQMVPNVNVNVNVDFCFRISCELGGRLNILGFSVNLSGLNIAKSQALEIVYCKNSGAIEGMVSEGESFSWVGT